MFLKNLLKVSTFVALLIVNNAVAVDNEEVEYLVERYNGREPKSRGENIFGVIKAIDSKAVFLTFDFCRTGFDEDLMNFLVKEKIPATLFMTKAWIDNNPIAAASLAKNPLFIIQNHGTEHKPCFAKLDSVYGIGSTKNVLEIIDEIQSGSQAIFELTQKKPTFYRSGTANYDNICINIANDLGYKIAGFAVNGDGGATYNAKQVYNAIIKAKPGDIVLLHGNRPKSGTAVGVKNAVIEMKKKNIQFEYIA